MHLLSLSAICPVLVRYMSAFIPDIYRTSTVQVPDMNRRYCLVICLFHWGSIIDILEIFTWYVVGQTATEIIYYNVDATKLHMGLTTWAQAPDGNIMKSDVAIAKNYLSEEHMRELNRIVEAYINLAETRAKNHRPTTMQQWAEFLDNFLTLASYPILMDKGKNWGREVRKTEILDLMFAFKEPMGYHGNR